MAKKSTKKSVVKENKVKCVKCGWEGYEKKAILAARSTVIDDKGIHSVYYRRCPKCGLGLNAMNQKLYQVMDEVDKERNGKTI